MKKQEIKTIYENFFKEVTLSDIIGRFEFGEGHKYSLFNELFLMAQAQKNGLSYLGVVKPFNKWSFEKIKILKGQKALSVFCPMFIKYTSENKESGEQEQNEVLKGFIQRPVFDISQTNHPKVKEYQKKKDELIYKNDLGLNYESVKVWVISNFDKQKFREELKKQDCKGYFRPSTNEIVLHQKDTHTLIHEFSHSITQDLKDLIKNNYAYNEIIAEITTFLISKKLGSTGYNFNYSNIWSSRIEDLKDFELFIKVLSQIEKKIKKLNFESFKK